MEIGKGYDVRLEELPGAFVARERGRKGIRFPDHLRVETLDERVDVMRIPRGEELANDVEMVLSRHIVLLWPRVELSQCRHLRHRFLLTLPAELRRGWVLLLAPGASHEHSPRAGRGSTRLTIAWRPVSVNDGTACGPCVGGPGCPT